MKIHILGLLFLVGCSKPDRMKEFIQYKLLPTEMQNYELTSYEAIKLDKTCRGKTIYVIPSESFDLPIDAGLGVNLCGSGDVFITS